MTPDERLAMKWIEARLRTHVCSQCGGQWVTAASIEAVYHRCANATNGQHPRPYPDEEEHERRNAWARKMLGSQLTAAFEDAVGPTALYRRNEQT